MISAKIEFNDDTVRKYRGLVRRIAREYKKLAFKRRGYLLEDLVQEGLLGLKRACEDWEPGRGATFQTVLNLRVRNVFRAIAGLDSHRDRAVPKAVQMLRIQSIDESKDKYIGEFVKVPMGGVIFLSTLPEQEDLAIDRGLLAQVEEALAGISADERNALLATTIFEETERDAAARTDIAPATLHRRRASAIRKIREALGLVDRASVE